MVSHSFVSSCTVDCLLSSFALRPKAVFSASLVVPKGSEVVTSFLGPISLVVWPLWNFMHGIFQLLVILFPFENFELLVISQHIVHSTTNCFHSFLADMREAYTGKTLKFIVASNNPAMIVKKTDDRIFSFYKIQCIYLYTVH